MSKTLILGTLLLFMSAVPALAEERPEPLSADYVIGLLQAGMTGEAIVEHILEKELAFVVRKGDIDRLLEAGAGEDVLMAVLQNTWSRPRRLDAEGGEYEESEEESYTDSSVQYYGAFYFGWPGSYYYSPYYYGGYAYYYPYYYNYGGHHYNTHGYYRYGGHYGRHGGKVGVGVGTGLHSGTRGVHRGGHRSGHSRGMSARGHGGGHRSRGMSARGHGGGHRSRGMSSRGHGGHRGGRGRGGGRGHR